MNLAINANNRITTAGFNYDAAGNLTADVTSSYAWNAESEIKTANSVNYIYDGDGNRVQKSNGKIYWYGAGTEILDESDASGNFTDEYVFFGGKRVAHRSVSSGNIFYYAEDMLGSSRAMVQAGQTSVCYDADFYPYGGEKVVTNTCPQNYKFEGKERDTETGNDDFGARYYSSVYGRWLSPDWSSVPAPVPYANLNNPQTLNLYAMVADNPETFADLDGHETTGSGCDANTSVDCAGKLKTDKPAQPPPPQNSGNATDKTTQSQGWSLSWQLNASANFLVGEVKGFADATVNPIVNAVEHPIDTVKGIADAVEHPIETAKNVANAAVDTVKAAASGDARAFGQIVGTAATAAYGAQGARVYKPVSAGGPGGAGLHLPLTKNSYIRFDIHRLHLKGSGATNLVPHIDLKIGGLEVKHFPWKTQ